MSQNNVYPFTPRMSQPSLTSKYYVNYKYGGINTCIVLDSKGCVMPNCVGYAQGRFLEIHNATKCDWKLPACNAEDWYEKAKANGLKVGSTPKLGSVIVWGKGKLHTSSDGCGHVAVVEKIDSDGTITISESGYKTFIFKTEKIPKPYTLKGYNFLGFIYPYIEFDNGTIEPIKPVTSSSEYRTHKVVKGDVLWNIAKTYLGSGARYKEIMNLNNLTTSTIYVGQVLKIPN